MAVMAQWNDSTLVYYIKTSLSVQALLISVFWLLVWRQWKFFISPSLYPDRPKTYPYWIPFLGHAFSFFRDGDGTVTRARLHFQNTREPFKLVIMGETVYVITSPHDTALVHKKVENLSMDRWVMDLMEQFGASTSSMEAMWSPVPEQKYNFQPKEIERALQTASEEPLAHVCQLLFRLNLSPGEQADAIQQSLLGTIHERMTWEGITDSLILSDSRNSRVISLLKWSQHFLLEGATTSFFGKALLQVEPDLFKHFCEFDDSSWKLSYRVPGLWAKDVRRSKAFAQDAMQRYYGLLFSFLRIVFS